MTAGQGQRVKQLKKALREKRAEAVINGNSGRRPANYRDDERYSDSKLQTFFI
jgi:hypothetical protein